VAGPLIVNVRLPFSWSAVESPTLMKLALCTFLLGALEPLLGLPAWFDPVPPLRLTFYCFVPLSPRRTSPICPWREGRPPSSSSPRSPSPAGPEPLYYRREVVSLFFPFSVKPPPRQLAQGPRCREFAPFSSVRLTVFLSPVVWSPCLDWRSCLSSLRFRTNFSLRHSHAFSLCFPVIFPGLSVSYVLIDGLGPLVASRFRLSYHCPSLSTLRLFFLLEDRLSTRIY